MEETPTAGIIVASVQGLVDARRQGQDRNALIQQCLGLLEAGAPPDLARVDLALGHPPYLCGETLTHILALVYPLPDCV